MKFFVLTLVALGLMLAGCVSTSPLTPEKLPRLKLISLYEDDIVVLSNPSLLKVQKELFVAPGVGVAVAQQIAEGFSKSDYRVSEAGITPEAFWRTFDATAKTKEGSSGHLGVLQNLKATLKKLIQEGSLRVDEGEAIAVIGPLETYHGANFMSRSGLGVNLFKDPFSKLGAGLTCEINIFDPKGMEVIGYGTSLIRFRLEFENDRFDFKNLSPADQSEVTKALLKALESNIHILTESLKYRAVKVSSSK